MSRPVRAALLSAFVFPGFGQLHLKRPRRACVFMLPALVAAGYFVSQVLARASVIADEIAAGRMPFDPTLIAARLESESGSPLTTAAVVVMVVCWGASIVDAWLLGRSTAH